MRNPAQTVVRIAQVIFYWFMAWSLYWRLGDEKDNSTDQFNRIGVAWGLKKPLKKRPIGFFFRKKAKITIKNYYKKRPK